MRLIDADSLIDLVKDSEILGDGFKQAFVALVNGEPTIEPERKRGKWTIGNRAPYKCSECGRHQFTRSDYCPNCGSKMGEQE